MPFSGALPWLAEMISQFYQVCLKIFLASIIFVMIFNAAVGLTQVADAIVLQQFVEVKTPHCVLVGRLSQFERLFPLPKCRWAGLIQGTKSLVLVL